MKKLWILYVGAISILFVVPFFITVDLAVAKRPADFCQKHPEHKDCKPKDTGATGCPPGTIYIDTWGCVPWE